MARGSIVKAIDMYYDVRTDPKVAKQAALKADAAYIAKGEWKCVDSPSGAHHWVRVTYNTDKGWWHCIYCHDFRTF